MRETLEEILRLQENYSSQNTELMQRRGSLIRRSLTEELKESIPILATASQIEDLAIQGQDGIGLKAEVPWIRIFSQSRSPRATNGWYLVYLFSASGRCVYLSLNQGTTYQTGDQFKSRPSEELLTGADWARRNLLLTHSEFPKGWTQVIKLDGTGKLAPGYELGNVIAASYSREDIPTDDVLIEDLTLAAHWLGVLYRAPDDRFHTSEGRRESVQRTERTTGDTVGHFTGEVQGTGLSAPERSAVEQRAVDLVASYLKEHGFSVSYVGDNQSYDIYALQDDNPLYVEVKGTTSTGTEVIITHNELLLHWEKYPNNAIAIVHSISLDRSHSPPLASDGELEFVSPWMPKERNLRPIAYRYRVDPA